MLRACGADATTVDRITSLAGRSDAKSWWAPWAHVVPDWFKTYVGLEGPADAAFVFESMVIPGLLQTQAYAQALTKLGDRVGVRDSKDAAGPALVFGTGSWASFVGALRRGALRS